MKRVLVVFNSFFGPGMGHTRMLRILRQLPAAGWEPTLLAEPCRHEPFRNTLPPERVTEVPYLDLQHVYARLRGRRSAVAESTARPKPQSRSIGFTTFINRWFMVPDKQVLWVKPARNAARELHRKQPFNLVFASGLPATNVVAGAAIARDLNLPLVVEYRDLWTGNPYHNLTQPSALHRWLHRRMERRALRSVTRLHGLSTGIADIVTAAYRDVLRVPPTVCYNFFDPDEFAAAGPAPVKPDAFTISYVGTMYLSRNPGLFFRALRMFIERNGLTPEQFRFRWLGFIVGIADLQRMIDENGVAPYIDFLGQIPHRDALNELRASHVSLIIQAPDDAIHIPGKMFEAMGARVPLLAIAQPCEVTRIIDRTGSGLHAPYDADAVAGCIERLWRHAQSGSAWHYNEKEVSAFSAQQAVTHLAGIFSDALAP